MELQHSTGPGPGTKSKGWTQHWQETFGVGCVDLSLDSSRPPSPAGRLDGSDLEGGEHEGFWKIREQDGRRQGWYLLGTGAGSVLCGIASAMIQRGDCRSVPGSSKEVAGGERCRDFEALDQRRDRDDRAPPRAIANARSGGRLHAISPGQKGPKRLEVSEGHQSEKFRSSPGDPLRGRHVRSQKWV